MSDWLTIRSDKFTSQAAFIRETLALLQDSSYKLILEVRPSELERLEAEMTGQRTLGRVKVKVREAGE